MKDGCDKQLNVLLIASIFLLFPFKSRAAEIDFVVDTTAWRCDFCGYATGWFGSFDFGAGYVSESNLKFANYRGLDEQGAFLSFYGNSHYRDLEGSYFDLYARDLGTSARQLEMRGGKNGKYEFRLAYKEIPTYRGLGATTPFLNVGTSQLGLPVDWVGSPSTAGMSTLSDALAATGLQTQRKNFDVGLSLKLSGNWHYQVDYRHSEKNGTRPFGAGVFTIQSSIFPVPVDFNTNRIDMGLEYSGTHARLRFGLSGSWFNNGSQSVSWENPFSPIGNTQLLRAALEPDSEFEQFNFTGVYLLGPKVRVSTSAALGRIKQDDAFLPYSSNPDFEDLSLPQASLNQKIDSSTFNFTSRLVARFSSALSLTARFKKDERDNRTPSIAFTPVITDLVLRPETYNRPYSFERSQYSAELNYRPPAAVSFLAGVKRKDYKRSLQSVRKTEDSTFWGEINIAQWATAQMRVRLESTEREISPYLQVSDTGLTENVLMRKFNLAGRSQDKAVIEVDFSPTDKVSASLSYFSSKNDYDQSVLGLLKSDESSYSLDIAYALMNKFHLHVFISREKIDSQISAAENAVTAPWLAQTQDRFTIMGLGLSGELNDKMSIDLDYVTSDSTGRINTNSGAGEAPLPDLETDLRSIRLRLKYRINDKWGMVLIGEHEKYQSTDWQIDGLSNDGIAAILTLGDASPDYSTGLVRLMARYQF